LPNFIRAPSAKCAAPPREPDLGISARSLIGKFKYYSNPSHSSDIKARAAMDGGAPLG
jgi:hypothetical protein